MVRASLSSKNSRSELLPMGITPSSHYQQHSHDHQQQQQQRERPDTSNTIVTQHSHDLPSASAGFPPTDGSISGSTLRSTSLSNEEAGKIPPPPAEEQDGGWDAWLQVVGSFFINMNSWGIINSFGVYQTFYESGLLFSQTPSNISWIGSLQGFLLVIVGVISGPVYDAGHFQLLLRAGAFITVLGIFMTSLCSQYWQVMLSQALLIGLGSGCVLVPSFAIIPQYFQKRRALATGLASSGSSMGGVIYPIVFHRLQPLIGFAWATRVIGFLALAGLLVSCSVMKVKRFPPAKRALLEVAAFREPPYALFCAALFFTFAGLYIPVFYIYSYAVVNGITNTDLGFYLIPILNAGSVFGRTIPSFIADTYGALNVLIPCAIAAGILCFSWIAIQDVAGLIVFAVLYGFFSGAFLSLPPTIVVHLSPSLRVVGTRMGMALGVGSFGLLIGTPVSGAILENTGTFHGLQIFAGAIVFTAAVLMLGSRFVRDGKKC